MARDKINASKSQNDDELVDDDFDGDDSEVSLESVENNTQPDKLVTRRRIEDYFEQKRLREEMGDDYF